MSARTLKKVQAGLGGGLVLLVVALGGGFVLANQDRAHAADDLAVEQTHTQQLLNDQQKYADVPRTIAAIESAEISRETAMSQDVEWYRQATNFALSVPSDVWFRNVSFALTSATAAPAATAATTGVPTTTTAGSAAPIATISVEGSALEHVDVAAWLDTLARQPGVVDPTFSQSTQRLVGKKTVVDFTSSATVTSEDLSHRYDRKQG
ncbi:hypothetical protein GCM10025868_03740 [Angustibacter aerolatus]|uniref:PilN domain-containing protein n=1 Tax=Angustibacter aerolatus TaxID=1162965 RepID=A0ABQ6JBE6_9ACTN|nr:PilN domain-containing protein [Angustibacter aerolatus]GMA85124.1 hypothetical protein GCM10025868_03740 [Angustibacter aerolatus]